MSRADTSLRTQLDELQGWLRGLRPTGDAPSWSRVLLIDEGQVERNPSSGNKLRLDRDALRTPEAFEPRWREIVAEGRTSWINLSALGVWNDVLVVVAESSPHGVPGRFTPHQISVNFSGPPAGSNWALLEGIDLI